MFKSQFPFLFPKKSPYHSDKGFAVVFLLSLLPLLLSVLFLVALGTQILQAQKSQRHFCRMGMLKYQETSRAAIEQLQSMNFEARFLRGQIAVANAMMLVPATAVAGRTLKSVTRIQQRFLQIRQKTLLFATRVQLSNILSHTKSQIKKVQVNGLFIETDVDWNMAKPLAIRPDRKSDIAPVYVLESQFSDKQTQQVSWKSQFSFSGGIAWKKWIGWTKITHQQSCAATLVESKTKKLEAQLTKAKFLPSSLLPLFF